jgi:hypothetical protein
VLVSACACASTAGEPGARRSVRGLWGAAAAVAPTSCEVLASSRAIAMRRIELTLRSRWRASWTSSSRCSRSTFAPMWDAIPVLRKLHHLQSLLTY